MRTSSLENGGRKSPFKFEIRKDFYIITVSFALQYVFEMFFIILRTFSILPNVTAPVRLFTRAQNFRSEPFVNNESPAIVAGLSLYFKVTVSYCL